MARLSGLKQGLALGLTAAALLALILAACAPAATPSAPGTEPAAPSVEEPSELPETPEAPTPVVSTPAAQASPAPAQLLERRQMVWEWPEQLREGDADVVDLRLKMDAQGTLTPTAQVGGHVVEGQGVEIPNLYDTHNLVVEARLDLVGFEMTPQGEVSEPLRPGEEVVFRWTVRCKEAGNYRGTLWVALNLVPKAGGETLRRVLLAAPVDIEVRSVWGLPAQTVRILGGIGTAVSTVLGIPFLEQALGWVWKRTRRKQTKTA